MLTARTEMLPTSPEFRKTIELCQTLTPAEIFRDLFEHARKRGAAEVFVSVTEIGGASSIRMQFDGCPIETVLDLFNIPPENEATPEDFAINTGEAGLINIASRNGLLIRSPGKRPGAAFRATIAPDHLLHGWPIDALPEYNTPESVLAFSIPMNERFTLRAIREAERDACVAVYVNGDLLTTAQTEPDPIFTMPFRGMNIKVHQSHGRDARPHIRCHGVAAYADLPIVRMQHSDDVLYAVVTVEAAADLKFEYPRRNRISSNPFFGALREACQRAVYQAVSALNAHSLAYDDWLNARALGISLPGPVEQLRPFVPSHPSEQDKSPSLRDVNVATRTAIIVDRNFSQREEHSIARLAEVNGDKIALFSPSSALEGFGWYDRLPRLKSVKWFVTTSGGETECEDLCEITKKTWVRNIRAEFTLQYGNGRTEVEAFHTDVLLTGYPYSGSIYEFAPIIIKQSGICADQLMELLFGAHFVESDDEDALPVEEQELFFKDDCRELAFGLLHSPEAGQRESIRALSVRCLAPRLSDGQIAMLTITQDDVSVRLSVDKTEDEAAATQ